ncbi:LysE family translocator [Pararhodospirillum oryzae]|uniref:Threonine transporter n=1 Tax=Pararhodospirillum oryzae TaxID=478448 RepID=A0A512HAP9_9PROT|nr:LysE family transporter [Pararhodospirillum oryzae]GEO82531.1 threonine transporter [Pararhodospirillum oryzae]
MSVMESLLTLGSIAVVQALAVMSPGPSFLVVARTAMARSRSEGVKVAVGLALGTVVWSSAALLGLNALFQVVPVLFTVMKAVGALFLLWIAVQTFRHARAPLSLEGSQDRALANPFVRGFLTQVSNPKVVVFFGSLFIALLPAQVPAWMVVALVVLVSFNELWWYSTVSLFCGVGPVRAWYLRAKTTVDRVTGVFLGALGLKLLADVP